MKRTIWFEMLLGGILLCGSMGAQGAESGSEAAGHWEGSIQLPTMPLEVRVDLERSTGGSWSGTIDIPAQGLRGFKLGGVDVKSRAVSFVMPGIPGDPKFAGDLDQSARLMSGNFTQGGQSFPFKLQRTARKASAGETPTRGVPGKGLSGHWQGSLKPSPVIELRLALEITNAPGGGYGGVMISVDQGAARIPITTLTEKEKEIRFEAKSVGGSFDGKMSEDGSEISGTWRQGGGNLPLMFKRLEKAIALTRPQDPKKPFPYNEEEVVIEVNSAGVKLAGTLTSPRAPGPHPAVVLISGSGPQDRDEAIMGHRPFLVLADHLTRNGVAVLRCDDRGIGKSTGNFSKATDTDFVDDALAAVAWLRGRKDVNRIGLIGHSEGGIVAPRAAVRSSDVAFVVLLAGVGLPMDELLARQAADISRAMGLGEGLIARNAEVRRAMFRLVREEKDEEMLRSGLRKIIQEQVTQLTEEQRTALGISEAMIEQQLATLRTPWFRELLAYDPRPTLKLVKCPVLALNGEKDLQVSAKENLAAIRDSMQSGGNQRVTVMELSGLNHLFQSCQTGAVMEYSQIEETFSPKALKMISDWILETAGSQK